MTHKNTTLGGKLGILAAVSAIAMAAATSASAQSFALRSQNAEGTGMAHAGAAAGSISGGSMFFNPATITMLEGRRSEWNFNYTRPDAEYSLINTNSPIRRGTGDIGLDGGLTLGSFNSWQINDRLWIGLTSGTPYGLRSKPDNQVYAGQIYGRSSTAKSFNFSPTVGFKVTDWLSVGAALQVQWFKADLKSATGIGGTGAAYNLTALGPNAPSATLRGEDIAFGYRLGVTVKPTAATTIGLGFRSAIFHELDGNVYTTTPSPLRPNVDIPIKANLNLPEAVNLGISHQINDQWQVHFTAEWQNWSRFGTIAVRQDATGAVVTTLPFEYDDSYHFALGAEYQWNQNWTFRAGVAYDISPVSDTVRGLRISDADRLWTSIGFSYKWNEKLQFDFGYSHIFVQDAPVNIVPGHIDFRGVVYQGEAEPSIDVISFGIKYRWDDPSKPIPALPLVRKG